MHPASAAGGNGRSDGEVANGSENVFRQCHHGTLGNASQSSNSAMNFHYNLGLAFPPRLRPTRSTCAERSWSFASSRDSSRSSERNHRTRERLMNY